MRRLSAVLAICTAPWFAVRADQPLPVPIWLSPYPTAVGQTADVSSKSIESSYTAPVPVETIVAHYQERAEKAAATVKSLFDGMGTTMRIADGKLACVIRISKNEDEDGSAVQISCAVPSADSSGDEALLPLPPEAPARLTPRPAHAKRERPAEEDPGMKQVEFEVDGDVNAAEVSLYQQQRRQRPDDRQTAVFRFHLPEERHTCDPDSAEEVSAGRDRFLRRGCRGRIQRDASRGDQSDGKCSGRSVHIGSSWKSDGPRQGSSLSRFGAK